MLRSRVLIHPDAAGRAFVSHGAGTSSPSHAARWVRLQILVEEPEAETLRAALFARLGQRLQSVVLTPHVCVGKSQAWAALEVEFEPGAIDDVLELVKHSASAPRFGWSPAPPLTS